MQQSRDKYFPQLENQGINPVGDNTTTKKYFGFYLSLSDLTFPSNSEGIDNPFIALGASFLIVCAGIR